MRSRVPYASLSANDLRRGFVVSGATVPAPTRNPSIRGPGPRPRIRRSSDRHDERNNGACKHGCSSDGERSSARGAVTFCRTAPTAVPRPYLPLSQQ